MVIVFTGDSSFNLLFQLYYFIILGHHGALQRLQIVHITYIARLTPRICDRCLFPCGCRRTNPLRAVDCCLWGWSRLRRTSRFERRRQTIQHTITQLLGKLRCSAYKPLCITLYSKIDFNKLCLSSVCCQL